MGETDTVDVDQKYVNATVNLALDTLKIEKQALVFVNSKRSAEKTAEDIAQKIKTVDPELQTLAEQVVGAIAKPTKQCERLGRCVAKGTAFHHSGLTQKQRQLIEDSFRSGKVKIIACTPTLAAGVDLPAYRAIIRDLKRYSETGWGGMQYIPVLEYLQMAGRAGRPSYDSVGEAICIVSSEAEKEAVHEKYIRGEPEEIYSKLAVEPVLRTYILSLIATEFVHTKSEILDFFSRTFWAFQFKDMQHLRDIIERMLDLLERYEFIIMKPKDDFVSADEIRGEDEKIRATFLGRRVAQLYIDPLTAHHLIKRIRRSTEKMIHEFGLLQMVTNTLEMRPLLRVKTKEFDTIMEQFNSYDHYVFQKEPSIYEPEYDEFLASVKTAFFLLNWIEEKDEEYLLQQFDVRPGETRVKIERADWLLYCCEELAKIMHFNEIVKQVIKLRFRLKYGVKEELLPLLRLRGIGRVRARKMFTNGIKDIGDVKKTDVASLAQLLGKALAIDVKKQVGQEVEVPDAISDRRRKGQMSLGKYQD